MVRVRSPTGGLAVVVVPGGDAEGARRIGRAQRRPRFADEDQRRFIDAQEDLVSATFGRPFGPDVLADLEPVAGVSRRGADRILAEEVGPDGERPAGDQVLERERKPGVREGAIIADALEPQERPALDLGALRVAQIAALAPAGEQAIGRIGDERVGALSQKGALIGGRVSRVAFDAGHEGTVA